MKTLHARVVAGTFVVTSFGLLGFVAEGCGSSASTTAADPRFAAETYDENTQPLTNAVVGTPEGIVTVDENGVRSAPVPAAPLAPAAQPGAGTTVTSTASVTSGTDGGGGPTVGPSGSGGGSSSGLVFGTSSGVISGSSSGAGSGSGVGSSSGGIGAEGGMGAVDGGGGDEGGGAAQPFGQWHFDDCSPTSHFLIDSSGFGANAQHNLKSSCVPGISGLGVQFKSVNDLVQVPDEPQFTVSSKVAVAAWVKPTTVSGDQPIVLKRLNNNTSFSLGIHNGNIQMSVVTNKGKTFVSQAPIQAGVFTHVAGMYDGTFVFLFINGQQFGQVFVGAPLRDEFAPIRIGATTQTQHFNGIIDEVFVSMSDITKDQVTALACITNPFTFSVKPATSGLVPPDTTVHYDITATNNDIGFCQPSSFEAFQGFPIDPGFTVNFDQTFVDAVAPQTSATFGVEVTGTEDADPGLHQIPFSIFRFGTTFEQQSGQLTYDLAQPTGCFVTRKKELMITDVSVVDDPVRTAGVSFPNGGVVDDAGGGGGTSNPGTGVWSFGQLVSDFAPKPEDAPAMILQLLQTWLGDQTVNNFTVPARPLMQSFVIDAWPKTDSGALDLTQSPLTLSAIVTRLDLRNLALNSAGELRFVFGVNGQAFPNFTMILEYNLPAKTTADVLAWANKVHALASHPFPSQEYNAALEALTRSVTGRGMGPAGSVNGSNLVSFRTNEIALSFEWQLRQFALSPATGFLAQQTVVLTPDNSLNNTQALADFINANEPAIIAEQDLDVPLTVDGAPFAGGAVLNPLPGWTAPGINNNEARFHFSLNTCNGCHGNETNTGFLMVAPRTPGSESALSVFLTGTTVSDPVTNQGRNLNELGRRRGDLTNIVCSPPADGAPLPPPPTIGPQASGNPPPVGADAGAPGPGPVPGPAPMKAKAKAGASR
jgi:hypothetical protein